MTNEEILNEIKKVITALHPYMENRLSILLNNPSLAMDISFFFHPSGTTIMFLDGTENAKRSISKKINLEFIAEPSLIISLITMLLKDHDYIKDIQKGKSTLLLSTDVELSLNNYAGIACKTIDVKLDFSRYPQGEKLLDSYYDAIVCAFYDQVKDTSSFKYQFVDEGANVKRDIISGLTKEEMLIILESLNDSVLQGFLNGLSVPEFMTAYNAIGRRLIK